MYSILYHQAPTTRRVETERGLKSTPFLEKIVYSSKAA